MSPLERAGPILGGWLLDLVGQGWLMLCTGAALACISGITLLFVGDGCLRCEPRPASEPPAPARARPDGPPRARCR